MTDIPSGSIFGRMSKLETRQNSLEEIVRDEIIARKNWRVFLASLLGGQFILTVLNFVRLFFG